MKPYLQQMVSRENSSHKTHYFEEKENKCMIECVQMCNRLNLAVGGVAAAVAVTGVVVLAVLRRRRFRKGWTSFNIQA